MKSGSQHTIEMYDSLRATYTAKRTGGLSRPELIKRIIVSTDVDWPFYSLPMWHFRELIKYNGQKEPTFYKSKNLVNNFNLFCNWKAISKNVIKFEKKEAAYYLLQNDTNKIIELNELTVGRKFEMNEIIITQETNSEVIIVEGQLQLSAIPLQLQLIKKDSALNKVTESLVEELFR